MASPSCSFIPRISTARWSRSSRSDLYKANLLPVRLVCGDAVAEIDPLGAQWTRWFAAGQERLWARDPAVWDAVAPILFPVVGWTRDGAVRVGDKKFPLGLHGFAAQRMFDVVEHSTDRVVFRDRADAQTRNLYPFDYTLDIAFDLDAPSLSCTTTVQNTGDDTMPYAIGLHPGFRWGGDGRIVFDDAEQPTVPVITDRGLFSSARRTIPLEDHTLLLSHDLLSREALCFLNLRSKTLISEASGLGRLRIEMDDFPHVALWSRPPAPFLCIEAWTGHGDPDGYSGDLRDKPSMRLLTPGSIATHAARYTIVDAA